MADTAGIYDCQTCGACCHSPWSGEGYVTVYDSDIERLKPTGLPILYIQEGADPPQYIAKLPTRLTDAGQRTCIAFAQTSDHQCTCTIYEHRPQACRKFEAGSDLCRDARQRLGFAVW